jgi:hypothetical protein
VEPTASWSTILQQQLTQTGGLQTIRVLQLVHVYDACVHCLWHSSLMCRHAATNNYSPSNPSPQHCSNSSTGFSLTSCCCCCTSPDC